jgi:hypothetical protein
MNKCLAVLLVLFGISSCSKNEHYYQTHPKELQKAISSCPKQHTSGLTCAQLEQLANRMNKLAYQLQLSPQGFGQKIMALQEAIAKEQGSDLPAHLTQNKQDLADHLAVVRWFESPTS